MTCRCCYRIVGLPIIRNIFYQSVCRKQSNVLSVRANVVPTTAIGGMIAPMV